MKRLKIKDYLSEAELKKLVKEEKNVSQLRIWQTLYYIKTHYGEVAKSISTIFGLSVSSIYHHVQNFNKYGIKGVILKPKGGRRRFYLTLEEEKRLLDSLTDKAKEGLIITMNDIREVFETKIGHKVSDDYLWDVFKRHNWSKKAPRPKNPSQDLAAQEAFKKKLPEKLEAVRVKFDKSLEEKPLLLFFQDEGRFGRINTLQRCWGPVSDRPIVCKQLIRQYTYAYTAVCPSTGETFSLILPYANSDSMKIFIEEMSKAFPDNRIAMIMDNASWHKNEEKIYPKNVKPIFLPPRSPELNPVENIWHFIKENFFNNRTFETIKDVEEKLCEVLSDLNNWKEPIKSISNYHWISSF